MAQRYERENGRLTGEVESLKKQVSGHEQQIQNAQHELQATKTSNAELTAQLLSRGQTPTNPAGLVELAQARSSQAQMGQTSAGIVSVYEENGKVHVIRELVIGTLQTVYDKAVKPGDKFPLKAIFKPHPIIAPGTLQQPASEENISWFIELQYKPQKSQATYDQGQSGQKTARREIDPRGGEETWNWSVVSPPSFESDKSDLIVYAEYQIGAQPGSQPKDIVHEEILFKQIIEPGSISRGFAWLKENLTYLLGTITVLVGIWATWIKTKKDKLELRLKEKESQATL